MSTLQIVGRCNVPTNEAAQLTALFCHECGFNPLPWMPRQFARLITEGFTVNLLEELISRTARAPRPSWAYLAAILDSCRAHGAHNLLSFLAIQRPSKAEFSPRPRMVTAQMYNQRDYTEEELASVGIDILEEARRIYHGEEDHHE